MAITVASFSVPPCRLMSVVPEGEILQSHFVVSLNTAAAPGSTKSAKIQ